MALDTNELRDHKNKVAERYVSVLAAVDSVISRQLSAVADGTKFHAKITNGGDLNKDNVLDPVEVAEMQARLVDEKQRIKDAAGAL